MRMDFIFHREYIHRMEFVDFTAARDDDGKRADRVLRKFLRSLPLSKIYSAMRKNLLRLNGRAIKNGERVFAGDVISIASFLICGKKAGGEAGDGAKAAESFPLDIVFQNENFLAVNKPRGVNSQGALSVAREVEALWMSRALDGRSLSFRPGPLHRLDKMTSGVLFFSQSAEGARVFCEWMRERALQKKYIAVAQGTMERAEEWNDALEKFESGSFFVSRAADEGEGRRAVTRARPLAHGALEGRPVTLALFEIGTGRHHQIRAQAALHGFPLAGDSAYGAENFSAGLLLHAREIDFPENSLSLPARVSAPLPGYFERAIQEISPGFNVDEIG